MFVHIMIAFNVPIEDKGSIDQTLKAIEIREVFLLGREFNGYEVELTREVDLPALINNSCQHLQSRTSCQRMDYHGRELPLKARGCP